MYSFRRIIAFVSRAHELVQDAGEIPVHISHLFLSQLGSGRQTTNKGGGEAILLNVLVYKDS